MRHGRRGASPPAAVRGLLAAALALAALVTAPARAEPPASPDASAFVTNGPVWAVARANGRTYVGGDFTRVGPRTGEGAELAQADGRRDATLPEVAGGEVLAAISDGAGGWYVGGNFTHMGGVARAGLAHVRADGTLDPAFDPRPNGTVRALALGTTAANAGALGDAGRLYVGGSFTFIGTSQRDYLAALETAGSTAGNATSWNPDPDVDGVHALEATNITFNLAAGGTVTVPVVFVGGEFAKLGPTAIVRLGAVWGVGSVDRAGTVNEQLAVNWNGNASATVRALEVGPFTETTSSGTTKRAYPVYAGGDFTSPKNRLAAVKFELTVNTGSSGSIAAASTYSNWDPSVDAPVRALALKGTSLYVGGDFTKIGEPTSPSQPQRNRIAAVAPIANATANPDATTLAFNPNADAPVRALAVSGDGARVFAGGDFAQVGGESRERIAALNAADGAAVPGWNPGAAGGGVNALAAAGADVYAGGAFTSVGGVARNRLAALDAAGAIDPLWNPNPNGPVRALAVSGDTVYAGGGFTEVGGQQRAHLAALSAGDGSVLSGFAPDPDDWILALAPADSTLYAGGAFSVIGGAGRSHIAALDAVTGRAGAWNPGANDHVRTLLASCQTVYAGGSFTAIGGAARSRIAELDPATGAATPWDPDASSVVYALARFQETVYAAGGFPLIGGAVRQKIAALDASTGRATRWNPSADVTVRALALSADGATVFAGGSFNEIGAALRSRLGALEAATGKATAWNPGASNPTGSPSPVRALAASGANLYVGGDFTQVSTSMQQGFASFTGGADAAGSETVSCAAPEPAPPLRDGPLPPPGGPLPDTVAPRVMRFSLTNALFRVTARPTATVARSKRRRRGGTRRARVPGGTTFRYALSEAGAVKILIERATRGRRAGKRCRKPSRRLRGRRRCVRHRAVGTLTRRAGARGRNRTAFSGRIGRRALAPGRYRATITVTDAAGNVSKPRRARFTVVKGRNP